MSKASVHLYWTENGPNGVFSVMEEGSVPYYREDSNPREVARFESLSLAIVFANFLNNQDAITIAPDRDNQRAITGHDGRRIDPFDPSPDAISWEDVARRLSLTFRYSRSSGWSVAGHSLRVANTLLTDDPFRPAHALWGLIHDAAEAYLGDIAAPLKPFVRGYADLETGWLAAFASKLRLEWPMPVRVKRFDLIDRARELKCQRPDNEFDDPNETREAWLTMLVQLTEKVSCKQST